MTTSILWQYLQDAAVTICSENLRLSITNYPLFSNVVLQVEQR